MSYISKWRLQDNSVVPIGSNLFGTCSSGASDTTKVVSLSAFDVLVEGVTIHVYFANANSGSNTLLQVGSTSAQPIKRNGVAEGKWESGSVISFTYSQGYWVQNDADVGGGGGGGETYTLSKNGDIITLTGSGGDSSSVTDDNTTYTFSLSGNVLTITPSNGNPQSITLPDDDTTYTISISGDTITLTDSNGNTQTATISDFTGATTSANGTNGFVPAPTSKSSAETLTHTLLSSDGLWSLVKLSKSFVGQNVYVSIQTSSSNGTYSDSGVKIDVVDASHNGLMSVSDKSKLDGIAPGAEVNVNADWNSSSGDSKILNKPMLGTASAKDALSSISADSNDVPTVTAVKNYVASAVTGAVAFQGTVNSTFAPTDYKAGYYWVVGTAGTYAGQVCEAGDMIFCINDYSSAYSASDFDVVQTNLDITSITNEEIDTIVAS